jgi:Fic family protein
VARAPHPDDIRIELEQLGARRARIATESQQSIVDLGDLALQARRARLTVEEIAAATGASRATVYAAMERSAR